MSNSIYEFDPSCFIPIVGLSRIDCDCFDENMDWDESLSGLFVDEAEGLSLRMIDALKDCENDNNLWLLMDTARTNAIRQIVSDSNSNFLQVHEQARPYFKGSIGSHKFKNSLTIAQTYAGQRWHTANVVSGYVKIKEINTFFSAAGTVTLSIYNNLNELLYTMNLATLNGRKVNILANPITLPLWNKYTTNLEYIFIYTYDPLNKPKDNLVADGCNSCGIKYNFDCNRPYYKSGSNKLAGWSKWLMAGDIVTNTLDFSDLECFAGNYSNGLSFTVETYCDLDKQLCFDNADVKDPSFMTLAFAIQHLTANKLIIDILTSPNISRYTMVNAETLNALKDFHFNKYKECLDWLVKNSDLKNTDCLKCRDKIKMGIGVL